MGREMTKNTEKILVSTLEKCLAKFEDSLNLYWDKVCELNLIKEEAEKSYTELVELADFLGFRNGNEIKMPDGGTYLGIDPIGELLK